MPRVPSLTLLRSQSDERLVGMAREGHERAFEAIVERYRKPLHRACLRLLPHGRAEDALQQALLAAWTGLQRGDDVRELRPWLYRIVQNTALNALRASGYDHDVLRDSLEPGDVAQEELERRAVVRQTLAGLAALPERQREALLRTAVEGHTQKQVARDLGLSSGAVRQLVHRARVRLRAAATAVTPLPVAAWLASAGSAGAPMAERIGELGAVGAGAGAAATVAKAGAAAVLAGGVMAGQAAREDDGRRAAEPQRADRRPESRPSAHATWPPAAARTAPPAPPPSPDSSRPPARHASSQGSQRKPSSARDDPEARRDDAVSRPPAAEHEERKDRPEAHDGEDRTQGTRVPVAEEGGGDDDRKRQVDHESSSHSGEAEDPSPDEVEPQEAHTETSELAAGPPAPEEHEDSRSAE
jgi:RNA polymerase sigma factor (sigma-70 family)